MRGEYPEYPETILNHNLSQVDARLAFMAEDDEDPASYGDAYFQRRNPITCEGLVQLTCGGPPTALQRRLVRDTSAAFRWTAAADRDFQPMSVRWSPK